MQGEPLMLSKHLKLSLSVTSLLLFLIWIPHALAGQVQLAWDAPTNSDGTPVAEVAGYYLYWQDSTGVSQSIDVGNETTYTIPGLTEGMTYTMDVTAYDTAGNESEPSNTVTVTIPSSPEERPTGTWVPCASEGQTCSFSGTRVVRYGANGTYVTGTFSGSVACTNQVFGDPIYGVYKYCDYADSPVSAETAFDADGDGKADLVWRNTTTGQVAVWLMNGTGRQLAASVGIVADLAWQIAGVGDFNGDGKADILWHHSTTGQLSVWLMNGAGRQLAASAGIVADLAWQIQP